MKTILIDVRFASGHSGLGSYTREIVRRLVRRDSRVHYKFLLGPSREQWLPDFIPAEHLIHTNIAHYSLAEQFALPRLIRSLNVDLYYSPHFNVPYACPVPFVVTVHDLILHHFPNNASFLKRTAYRALMRHAVHKARSIITVSDFVCGDILSTFPSVPSDRLHVIREGVSEIFQPLPANRCHEVLSRYGVRSPFFLYVGNSKQHKNVQTLIDAFVASKRADTQLVLITSGKEVKNLVLPERGVKILEGVPDTDLAAFYSATLSTVTAALYEGFCLPVAEALACGSPVIASNLSAIPEVASGHAQLIDPTVSAFTYAFSHPPSRPKPFRVGNWEDVALAVERVLLNALS